MLRQLADAQVQAENLMNGHITRDSAESFARFCSDLNTYIRTHVGKEDIVALIDELPEIGYKRLRKHLWQYLFIPDWLAGSQKRVVSSHIRLTREKYATLELLLRAVMRDEFQPYQNIARVRPAGTGMILNKL